MRDIFTPTGDDELDGRFSKRISFDGSKPEENAENSIFTPRTDMFEDFDTGRKDFGNGEESLDDNPDDYFSSILSSPPEPEKYYPDTEDDLPHESTDDEFTKKKRAVKVKKKGGKKVFKAVICILLVLVIGVFGYAFLLCGKPDYQPETHQENKYITENVLFKDKGVYNVLVIGTDKRETESTYRSDTMILVSLDKNTKKIKLTSFLRDSYVYIPAKDYSTKLNASCSFGGPQMVIDTLEYNFKVHIDKYVMIDFDIFKTIIHDLGGVTLTMTEEEAACIRRESGYPCKAGTHKYKAKIALWYARIRHLDSDFKRTDRQRKVIQAVIDKIKKTNPVRTAKMLDHVLPMVQTDIGRTELFKLGITSLEFLSYDIEEMQVPKTGTWSNATINGQAVLKIDLDKNTHELKNFIYETK